MEGLGFGLTDSTVSLKLQAWLFSFHFFDNYWIWFLNCGVGEDSWESLEWKEIKPVNSKGNQSWIFIERTDAEAEAPIIWPPDAKNWLIGKDPDAGKDWRQEEKGTTEDEVVGWHHKLERHKSEQTSGDGEGQGSLACCSPWGHKESDTTEQLNWTELRADCIFSHGPNKFSHPPCSSYHGIDTAPIERWPLCSLPLNLGRPRTTLKMKLWDF